jgi:hypothetical protein
LYQGLTVRSLERSKFRIPSSDPDSLLPILGISSLRSSSSRDLASDFGRHSRLRPTKSASSPPTGESVVIRALKVGRCPIPHSFISFACPKEMNQRKGQPQIFFGIAILSAAHAIQLALRLPADRSNSIAYY